MRQTTPHIFQQNCSQTIFQWLTDFALLKKLSDDMLHDLPGVQRAHPDQSTLVTAGVPVYLESECGVEVEE